MAHNHIHEGHKHDNETIKLTGEDGKEVEFIIEATLKVDDDEYAILIPASEDGDDAFVFKIVMQNGEEVLVEVEDDEEFEAVAKAYDELMDEGDDDDDDDDDDEDEDEE